MNTVDGLATGGRPVAEDVTVVIPTIGRPLIESCLQSLADDDTWPAKVIVVDQSRSASVESIVKRFTQQGMTVDYVPSGKRGPAAGTNSGLRRATTRVVARTDDDCLVGPSWIRRISELLNEHGDVVITGRVDPAGEGEVPSVITDDEPQVILRPTKRDLLYTNNFATTRDVIERVGLFDEHPLFHVGAEDNDWSHRALRAGIPLRYEPSMRVRHLAWRTADELETTYRRYAAAQGALFGKWIRRGDLHMLVRALRTLASGPLVVARSILKGDRPQARRSLRAMRHLWPALVRALLARGWSSS